MRANGRYPPNTTIVPRILLALPLGLAVFALLLQFNSSHLAHESAAFGLFKYVFKLPPFFVNTISLLEEDVPSITSPQAQLFAAKMSSSKDQTVSPVWKASFVLQANKKKQALPAFLSQKAWVTNPGSGPITHQADQKLPSFPPHPNL